MEIRSTMNQSMALGRCHGESQARFILHHPPVHSSSPHTYTNWENPTESGKIHFISGNCIFATSTPHTLLMLQGICHLPWHHLEVWIVIFILYKRLIPDFYTWILWRINIIFSSETSGILSQDNSQPQVDFRLAMAFFLALWLEWFSKRKMESRNIIDYYVANYNVIFNWEI